MMRVKKASTQKTAWIVSCLVGIGLSLGIPWAHSGYRELKLPDPPPALPEPSTAQVSPAVESNCDQSQQPQVLILQDQIRRLQQENSNLLEQRAALLSQVAQPNSVVTPPARSRHIIRKVIKKRTPHSRRARYASRRAR